MHFFFHLQVALLQTGVAGYNRGSRQEGNEGENIFFNLDKYMLQLEQIQFVTQTNTFFSSEGYSPADWGAIEVVARRAMEGKIVSNFSKRLQQGSNRVVQKRIVCIFSSFFFRISNEAAGQQQRCVKIEFFISFSSGAVVTVLYSNTFAYLGDVALYFSV